MRMFSHLVTFSILSAMFTLLARSIPRGRAFQPTQYIARSFRSSTRCQLNRFLFDSYEISKTDEKGQPVVTLSKEDYRTIHAAKILGLRNGDTIRAGLVSDFESHEPGRSTDSATIQWIPEGNVKKAEPLGNGDPPGSLHITLDNLQEPPATDQLSVSLILALPRPLQLGRILPMISMMGVEQIVLTGARKVPKDYFGSHLFRKPHVLRDKIIEGLCQAGDVRLPKVHVAKHLRFFLEDDLEATFPKGEYARVIAHPKRVDDPSEPLRMGDIVFPEENKDNDQPARVVLAVGPEGGWEEPGELDTFQSLGFQQVTLGTRTLRSDCAVVNLIGLANEICYQKNKERGLI
jgi:16S rRNA (uracil1498-N3)-methyltransferase